MARNNEMTKLGEVAEVMLEGSSALKGMRICISGHLGRPRKDIAALITGAGGIFHDNVKYDTTHLLTNQDWNANSVQGKSSKFLDAKRFRVKVINESTFYDMLTTAPTTGVEKW